MTRADFLAGLAAATGCWVAMRPVLARPAVALVMFERADCPFCRAWHRTIGPIYPKSSEGKRAPLRRVDLASARPPDLEAIERVVYTPTFVLVADGREIGRILGYAGEDAFWYLLGELIAKLAAAGRGVIPDLSPAMPTVRA
jgi:thioredoxin-related protein